MRNSSVRNFNSIRSSQGGFSLIELIAAFVIFALGFGLLLQILGNSVRTTERSADYTQAALWAQSKLDVLGVGERLKEGASSGEFDRNYRWDMRINKFQLNDGQIKLSTNSPTMLDLYSIDLTVSWGDSRHVHNAHFVTLRASNPDLNGAAMGAGNFGQPMPGVGR